MSDVISDNEDWQLESQLEKPAPQYVEIVTIPFIPLATVETTFLDEIGVPLTGQLKKLDDPRIQGYLPSKIWWEDDLGFYVMMYYINPTLPLAVRPFVGDTYVLELPIQPNFSIRYDATNRLFIDQVQKRGNPYSGRCHIVVFDDMTFPQLIAAPKAS